MKNNRFVINASWIMIGRVVQLLLTFVTTMLATRYLGPTEYGKLTYVFSYVQFFIPICTMGLNDIVVKELVDNKDENDLIVGTMLVMRTVVSLCSMVISSFLAAAVNQSSFYGLIAFLQSFSLMFQSFECIMYFYQSQMASQKSGLAYALGYVIASLFRILLIVMKKDIRWFAFAMSFDYIAVAVLLLGFYRKDRYRFRFSFPMVKRLLGKSYYYIFSGLLVVIYGKVTDILLLGKMVDETNVGYYGAATTLCNAWPFILTAIIDSANPFIIEMHRKDKEQFEKRVRQLYAAVFYIGIIAALGITVLSDFIIGIIYGTAFKPAAVPLRVFCWSTAFSYIGVARTAWMQCEKKTRYETWISLFGCITNILLNYFLIRSFGIVGAASAAVLTQLLTNFVFLFFVKDIRKNASLILDAILLKGVLPDRKV